MAIYPIVKGQKFSQKNAIPPRGSQPEPSAPPKTAPNDEGDLIDFGDGTTPDEAPRPAERSPDGHPPLDPSHKSTAEIQAMLASTGSRAKEGPLIDFHHDMEKSLPASTKRSDSDYESQDEFVDAQG